MDSSKSFRTKDRRDTRQREKGPAYRLGSFGFTESQSSCKVLKFCEPHFLIYKMAQRLQQSYERLPWRNTAPHAHSRKGLMPRWREGEQTASSCQPCLRSQLSQEGRPVHLVYLELSGHQKSHIPTCVSGLESESNPLGMSLKAETFAINIWRDPFFVKFWVHCLEQWTTVILLFFPSPMPAEPSTAAHWDLLTRKLMWYILPMNSHNTP